MKEKTKDNILKAFIGEAKAYFRLLAYAEKAEEEDLPQMAHLFRAIAEAERIHAARHMALVKDIIVKDTETNLKASFDREKSVTENAYPGMIKDAEADGEKAAATTFSHARDAEAGHLKLYEKALYHLLKEEETEYHLCKVCGYVADKNLPDKCPVCGAPQEQFKSV